MMRLRGGKQITSQNNSGFSPGGRLSAGPSDGYFQCPEQGIASLRLRPGRRTPLFCAVTIALLTISSVCCSSAPDPGSGPSASHLAASTNQEKALKTDWLSRWEKNILADAEHNRYCDKETGEELGWLVSPF